MPFLETGALLLTLGTVQGAPSPILKPCEVPGVGAARCGTYQVWENREARAGRKIGLTIVVIPAKRERARPDPIVFLHGGPGAPATGQAAGMAAGFAKLREDHDILLVDQRGTGSSHPLNCDFGPPERLEALTGDFFPLDKVRACRPELEKTADLTRYTTDVFADDLDEVRQALGYGPLDLFGGSYGTRAALTFLRRHPKSVRTAILFGVSPPDEFYPLAFARDAQRAFDGLLAECAAEAPCRAAFPGLDRDLASALERFAHGPLTVDVMHPKTGEPASFALSRDLFAEGLRYMLYSPSVAGYVPAVVHGASQGELGPAAEQALSARVQIVRGVSHGLYLSITCAEDVPWIDPGRAEALAAGTFLGDYRYRQQSAACREWPRAKVPADWSAPVRTEAPVLLISGELDPVTTPANGEKVAATLPNAGHVIVPHGGHQRDGLLGDDCIYSLMDEFIRTGSARELDVSCVAKIARPPFPTKLPETRVVRLSEAETARFAGRYAATDPPVEVMVALEGGRLKLDFFGREFLLAPTGAGRFRIVGAPLGFGVSFEEKDGAVVGLSVEQGASPPLRLPRKG